MALVSHLDFDMTLTWKWNFNIRNGFCIPKNNKKTSYTAFKNKWLESFFSRWVLAAILDLCRLRELPNAAILATKL